MKNSGLFLNMENCVFGFLFLRLYTYCGLFLCVYHKSAKNACFPQFLGFFWGWLLLLYLGLEGLYVLVFFVFGLLLVLVWFFLWLCFVLCLDVVVSVSVFLVCFFFLFFFLEGLRVR